MRIVNASGTEWRRNAANVRGGAGLLVKRLLTGRPGTPENYMLNMARSEGDYVTPRHRHVFDQIRLVLEGDMRIGPWQTVKEGQVAYFPEGTYYGPYDDAGESRTIMIVQFGGASGNGYMSEKQAMAAKTALLKEGEFENGIYRRHSGGGKRNRDAFEAVWEHAIGKLVYPKPRYDSPVIADPRHFDWKPGEEPGVSHKLLGSFSERQTRLECIRLESGTGWTVPPEEAIRLFFVLRGRGTCNEEAYSLHSAIEVEAEAGVRFHAQEETEFFCLVMPLLAQAVQARGMKVASAIA